MYIDTCLSEELINNTSQTTGLSIDTLLDAYIKSNIDCHEGKSHDLERAMNQFFVIISRFSENISKINEVCLHHISRRLEGSDNGNNSCLLNSSIWRKKNEKMFGLLFTVLIVICALPTMGEPLARPLVERTDKEERVRRGVFW